MRIEKKDGVAERQILSAMLCDKLLLCRVVPLWTRQGLFRSRFANVIANWAVEYFQEYSAAPKAHIEALFATWAEGQPDEATVSLIDSFLSSIKNTYENLEEETNSEYLVDLAAKHFNTVKLERLKDLIEGELLRGNSEEAWKHLSETTKLELSAKDGVNLLTELTWIDRTLTKEIKDPLVKFPSAMGEFLGVQDCFHRDCFVSFLGIKGVGKTFHLINVAWTAMTQRRKVAFFEVGDMSESQVLSRLLSRGCKRPIREGDYRLPTRIYRKDKQVLVDFDVKTKTKRLSISRAKEEFETLSKETLKSNKEYFKLSTHPARTLSVNGITSILKNWERNDFVPDVLVIDYADLLAPLDGKDDRRDQINETWMALRALSQSLHCLVVTATQAKALAYNADVMRIEHFSDDRRKIDHVNAMIGINQTTDEKRINVQRLNFISLREGEFDPCRCVHLAGCLAISDPCVLSML